jgi:hypothetical protein
VEATRLGGEVAAAYIPININFQCKFSEGLFFAAYSSFGHSL